jgi:PiT family inorganic phosphate transporter
MLNFVVIFIIIVALGFDFTNGFHDAANAIATTVSTRALKPKVALLMSAFMNLVGAMLGVTVANTIAKSIVDIYDLNTDLQLLIIFAALTGAITWNIITWRFGLPSSSSHALIGSLAGAGLVAKIFVDNNLHIFWYKGLIQKVVFPMVYSPLMGFVLSFVLMRVVLFFLRNSTYKKTVKNFKIAQIFSAAAMSLGHGLQDAQKTMGIVWICAIAVGWESKDFMPLWIKIICACAISFGTYAGGFRIIKTLGRKVIKLNSVSGCVAETSSSAILFIMAHFGFPVSTTHNISSSIMGAGATRNVKAVRWGMVRNIVSAWVLTIPATAFVSGICFYVLHLVLRVFGVM